MEKITQALNSSCVTPNQAPILVGSTGTSMSFYSGQNDHPGAIPDEITISLASPQPVPLLMSTQTLTGSAPTWTATSTPPSIYTLAPSVVQSVSAGATLPVFQYYGYGSGGTISTAAFPIASGGLTAAQAAATAKVVISYQVLPSDNQSTSGRPVDFSDAVVFRLTPPSGSPNAANLPCA